MLRDEDNKYCVDCDSKGPRWASWNLGLFVCIRCAGIHRNLGVHISKVKSVNLDSWTPSQVSSMQLMGNSRARAVYEANLPDGYLRPQNDQALEQFIRSKYEKKKYIAKEYVPQKPSEFPEGWQELIEAEKQKKDLRKIILPSHTFKDDNCNNQTGASIPTKAPTAADTTARPKATQMEKPSVIKKNEPTPKKDENPGAASNIGDLLGLDLGNDTQSNAPAMPSNAGFGEFASVANSSNVSQNFTSDSLETKTQNTVEGDNLKASSEDKSKMSKDSIMALFANTSIPTSSPRSTNQQVNMFGNQTQQSSQQNMFMSSFGTNAQNPPVQQSNFGMNPLSNPFLANSGSQMGGMNLGQFGGVGGANTAQQMPQGPVAQSNSQALQNQFGGLNLGTNSFSGMVPAASPLTNNGSVLSPTSNVGNTNQNNGQANLLGLWQ